MSLWGFLLGCLVLFLVVDAYLLLCFIGDTYLTAGLLVNGEIVRRGDTLVRSVY